MSKKMSGKSHFSPGIEAALRRQIISSSPELRALASRIQACAQKQYNSAAVAEKRSKHVENQVKEKEYAKILEEYGEEECILDALAGAERYAKKLETQRILREQIAEKDAIIAEKQAEKTLEMLSELDQQRLLKKDREEMQKKKEMQENTTKDFLMKQLRMKELKRQEAAVQDRNVMRAAEEYNLKTDLQKRIYAQQQQLERLNLNRRELSLVNQLEKGQERQNAIQNLRLEIEVLEKESEEKHFAEEKKEREAQAKICLKESWDSQVRHKQEGKQIEHQKEEEYRKILLEVLAEEARLDQLVTDARRRRQLDHRVIVDRILDERRAMRASIMRQRRAEDQHVLQYEKLRKEILQEEEQQLLLKHAPQLMPFYTPKLMAKLLEMD